SENSESKRRGFLSAFSQGGISIGFVLSSLVFFLVQLMPEHHFMAWGWRIPFLISLVLLFVGIWIRTNLPDENRPDAAAETKDGYQKLPMLHAIRTYPKEIVTAMGLRVAENGGSYIFLSFSVVYGVHVGVDQGILLLGVAISMTFSFFTVLFFGHMSDILGRRKVYGAGSVMMALMAFPFFWMIDSQSSFIIIAAFMIANGICHGAMIGTQPSFFHELFPAEVRYSAMSIAHEIAAVFAGGLAPMIATALLMQFDSATPVALYLIGLCTVTFIAVLASTGLKKGDKESTVKVVKKSDDPQIVAATQNAGGKKL